MKRQEVVIITFPKVSDKSLDTIQKVLHENLCKAMPNTNFYYTNVEMNTMSLENFKALCEYFLNDLKKSITTNKQ